MKQIFPTMITPYKEDGSLDLETAKKYVKFYYDNGCTGIFSVCQSSEIAYLSVEERVLLNKTVYDYAKSLTYDNGRVMTVVSSGHVADSIEQQAAELNKIIESGTDALILITNRLDINNEGDDVWLKNAKELLKLLPQNVKLGLYECPLPYKRLVTKKILSWCVETGRFYYMKDTCCNIDTIKERLKVLEGSHFQLLNANCQTLLESMRAGGAGYCGIMCNFHPRLYSWLGENYACPKADQVQALLGTVGFIEQGLPYPLTAKYHMCLEGIETANYARNRKSEELTGYVKDCVKQMKALTDNCYSSLMCQSNGIPWSYHPYKPFFFDVGDIYVCRISPEATSFTAEWLPTEHTSYKLYLAKDEQEEFSLAAETSANSVTVSGLEEGVDYRFYVEADGKKSRVRLVRTGKHVGVAVNYLHPRDDAYSFSGRFLCSPSLVRHPEGFLLASMDLFQGEMPQNLSLIFRSDDDGATWHYVSQLMPCFWGKLFIHKGVLYMIACSTEYGDLLIGASYDGGKSFTAPVTLLTGSNGKGGRPGVHKNPQNVCHYNGRLYITIEWGAWGSRYHAPTVISCSEDANLLDAANWVIPHPVKYDPTWPGVAKGYSNGNIEGTLVVSPENKLLNIMRYDTVKAEPNYGLALVYDVNTENVDQPITYSYAMDFPANLSKFMIKKDEKTGAYLTICSRITDSTHICARNLVTLMASTDLKKWRVVADLIDMRDQDPAKIGFQYFDFEIEGDDIIWLSRTAMNGAETYHNSNFITFHRTENFRSLL